jgi:ring-1,2-phenylacetyl-CoA epoxidase subunit PaaC
MDTVPAHLVPPLTGLLLAVADDKLLLGHRNSDWTGLAPILEEDIAFSALAQDEMAHAQALYELAGELSGESADQLAFGRSPAAYRCAAIVEVPDDFDWSVALARQLFCDHCDLLRLRRLARSAWKPLADLAARLADEETVHVEHADTWVDRLGNGTDESRGKLQAALDRLAPLAPGLFEPVAKQADLEAADLYPAHDAMFSEWKLALEAVVGRGGLALTLPDEPDVTPGGRHGHHTEHLGALLDEMCEVFRLEPDAAW